MNRRTLFLLVFVIVVSLLTGCGRAAEGKSSAQNAPKQQLLAEQKVPKPFLNRCRIDSEALLVCPAYI